MKIPFQKKSGILLCVCLCLLSVFLLDAWNAVLPILYCCAVLQKYEQNTSASFSKVRMPDWQIYGQNKGFCEVGYNQSVIELFAQLINNTFTCTKLQNTGKITQTLI